MNKSSKTTSLFNSCFINSANDMFESGHFERLEDTIAKDENERHAEVMREMREAITKAEYMGDASVQGRGNKEVKQEPVVAETVMGFGKNGPNFNSEAVIQPGMPSEERVVEKSNTVKQKSNDNNKTIKAKPSIIELANNPDFSIATISKEAKRLKERDEGEVFISLH